jgi:hypothetical protein
MLNRVTFRDWPYLVIPCVASAFVLGTALVDLAFGSVFAFLCGVLSMAGFSAWIER